MLRSRRCSRRSTSSRSCPQGHRTHRRMRPGSPTSTRSPASSPAQPDRGGGEAGDGPVPRGLIADHDLHGTRRPIRECIEQFEQGEEIAVASLDVISGCAPRESATAVRSDRTRLSTDDRARPASRRRSDHPVSSLAGWRSLGAPPGAKIAFTAAPVVLPAKLPADEFVLPAALIFDGSNGVSPRPRPCLPPRSSPRTSPAPTSPPRSSPAPTWRLGPPHLGRVVGRSRRHRAARRAERSSLTVRGPQLRGGRHHRPQQHAGHQHR